MTQPQHEPNSGNASFPRVERMLEISALVEMCRSPYGLENYSPLLGHCYLLLNLAAEVSQADVPDLEMVAQQLRLLPCPVIGVGSAVPAALLRGLDIVVDSLQETETIIRNVMEHPLAAMTLVQVLRHNEDVDAQQGLLAESFAYASLQGAAEFLRELKTLQVSSVLPHGPRHSVAVERRGSELSITLNRPQQRNAYSTTMRESLYAALQLLKADESLEKAVISGAGSCFSIGGDLGEFGMVSDSATAHAIRSSRPIGRLLLELESQLEFRLHRACIGAGIELPAFANRVVANKNTFIQLPEIKLGLIPGAGGTVSILRRMGRQRTAYLALSARKINASTALEWGLIDAII